MTHFWDRVGRNSPVYRRENSPRAYCTSPGALVNGMGHKTSREWQRMARNGARNGKEGGEGKRGKAGRPTRNMKNLKLVPSPKAWKA